MRTRLGALFLVSLIAIAETKIDPWKPDQVIHTSDLARMLEKNPVPAILMVGPRILYNGNHIKGAVFAGPAGTEQGLVLLRQQVSSLPKTAPIVLYCGCCPMDHCPNIRPAFAALRDAGYRDVKIVDIPTNLVTDWTEKGYAVEKGSIAK